MTWLDSLARRLARSRPDSGPTALPATTRPAPSPSATSRRDFLKKAGIVGGLAWSVPVLQTVMAPAASASVGTPIGQPCNDLGPCDGGNAYCNGTVCGGVGALCPASVCDGGLECSGRPDGVETCGGPGASCAGPGQCEYGNCANGTCGGQWALCLGGGTAECSPGRYCWFGLLCRV